VRETSWRATGLLQPIWKRLDVEKGHRDEFAKRTGFAGSDISSLNTGTLPMTEEKAQKIIDGVPELKLTLLDLRPAEPAMSERERRSLADRLEEVADLAARGFLALGVTRAQLRPPSVGPTRIEEEEPA
jgi:hypothetical protein